MKIKQEIKHIVQTNGPNKEIRARQSHARLEVIMKHKETYNVTHQIDTPWRNDERRLANVRKKKRAVKLRKWKRMLFIDEAIFRDQSSAGSFIFTIPSETKRTLNVYISLFFLLFYFDSFSFSFFSWQPVGGLVKTGGNQLALVSWHVPFDPARSAVKPLFDDINQESETDRCGYSNQKKERKK